MEDCFHFAVHANATGLAWNVDIALVDFLTDPQPAPVARERLLNKPTSNVWVGDPQALLRRANVALVRHDRASEDIICKHATALANVRVRQIQHLRGLAYAPVFAHIQLEIQRLIARRKVLALPVLLTRQEQRSFVIRGVNNDRNQMLFPEALGIRSA